MNYPFDPQIAAAIPALTASVDLTDLADPTKLPAARAEMANMLAGMNAEADESGVEVREEHAAGPDGSPDVLVRIYTPHRRKTSALLFDVHGGGFIGGSVETDHVDNLRYARELGVVVVSVEYRLAPETPYPGGLEDCYAALAWSVEHAGDLGVDPAKVVIHGASAGGGLCAGLALLARDRGGPPIAFQCLVTPEMDDRLATPSMLRFTDTPLLNRATAEITWDAYLGNGVRGAADVPVYAAPARATDLSGLPPAYVSVMEFDPLRDEGIRYAQQLLADGVPTELHLFPGTFHGSSLIAGAAVSRREVAETQAVLARALGVEQPTG